MIIASDIVHDADPDRPGLSAGPADRPGLARIDRATERKGGIVHGVMNLDDDGAVYLDDPRCEVATMVPPGHRVLDVGCSRGAFGVELKRLDPRRQVFGIEPTAAAHLAKGRLDGVVQGYFPDDLPSDWRNFDVVCFNDVLEHIADPWAILAGTAGILAPDGCVVASIPNVRYIEVVLDLALRGQWRYEDTGVLDRTHLRFFTRQSIRSLFEQSGFVVETLVPTHIDESKRLTARLLRRLGLRTQFAGVLAQRYIAIGRPGPRP